MLIEFSVGNYRSFKEKVTFSMVAANLVAKDKQLDANNVFTVDDDLKLLKSAAIYGANASGKSNLAKALAFMKGFIANSSKDTQSTDEIPIEPFRLSTETDSKPSFFELVFIMTGVKYRYGFEVTDKQVVSEWLFYTPKTRETKLFRRKIDAFQISRAFDADDIQKRTRNNALFLSVSAQFNVEVAVKILSWLKSTINITSGLKDKGMMNVTINCLLEKNKYKTNIIQMIKKLDLGIGEIKVEEQEFSIDHLPSYIPDDLREVIARHAGEKTVSILVSHRKFDHDGQYYLIENFYLSQHESDGTQKIFALAGPLVDTLEEGKTLIIDEFDARLHPLISRAIVELFNDQETNPNNAQLIFMTHDTNLLSNKIFRRDQIWFTEKNRYGATDLYSLAEFRIRNDASFESDYIKGKYGAIPYIGDLKHLIDANA
jgi:uncharacterized protein